MEKQHYYLIFSCSSSFDVQQALGIYIFWYFYRDGCGQKIESVTEKIFPTLEQSNNFYCKQISKNHHETPHILQKIFPQCQKYFSGTYTLCYLIYVEYEDNIF